METTQRCQSCAMPLGKGFYGTTADGSLSEEYCTFCFKNGSFTLPNQMVEEMIASSVTHMTTQLGISANKAQELAESVIPHLKRWKK